MKVKNLILLLILVAVLTALSTAIFYNAFVIEKIVSYNMTVKVDDHFGLAVDNESLNFGRITPGNSADKSISIGNPTDHKVKILILPKGLISDWVSISENNFILVPGEKKNVNFEVVAPQNAAFGRYNGTAEVIVKRGFFN